MFFTQEDYRKIEEYLKLNAKKDTDFQELEGNVDAKDTIAFVHEGKNYRMSLQRFASIVAGNSGEYLNDGAFLNMSWEDVNDSGTFKLTKYPSLAEAIANTPARYRIPGGVIAWLSERDIWQLHQFTGESADNWESLSLWKSFNDTTENGISFTSTLDQIQEGETQTTTVNCYTYDGGIATSMYLYKDDELIETHNGVAEFTSEVEIDSRTTLKVVVKQYSYTYTKQIEIAMVQEAWIGAAESFGDIMTDDYKVVTTGNMDGIYDVTFTDAQKLFIVIPAGIVIKPITLNGFEVPMTIVTRTIDEKEYTIYQSSNSYLAGDYTFIIGTYNGNEKDLLQSVQQNMGVLDNILGEQQEVNSEQQQDINQAKQDIQQLQQSLTITSDEEDITIVNGKYKFANKEYDNVNFSGMGRTYLRKNITTVTHTEGNQTISTRVNLLTFSMLKDANTIYIIQYDYTLNDNTITIPANCVLLFQGGSITGGTLIGNNTTIVNSLVTTNPLTDVTLGGTWKDVYGDLAKVAKTGNYNDLSNKPVIPTVPSVDNEDITIKEGQYKFADKDYEPQNYSGMGRIYLRHNIQTIDDDGTLIDKNILTQEMISESNTIYIIQYDYDLNDPEGESPITIPAGCAFIFEGGSINNGALVGDDTIMKGIVKMTDVTVSGTFVYDDTHLATVARTGDYNDLNNKPTPLQGTTRPENPSIGTQFFDTTLGYPIYWNGTKWVDKDGFTAARHSGTTVQRPSMSNAVDPTEGTLVPDDSGFAYFDTTLGKVIYAYNMVQSSEPDVIMAMTWVDATGVEI